MEQLKKCPFCGGEAFIPKNNEGEWCTWIVCKECSAESGYYESLEEAITAWNTRKPMERIMEKLEEAMERQWGYYESAKGTGNIRQMDYSDGCAEGLTTAIEIVKEEM